jgi:hypothetical protein
MEDHPFIPSLRRRGKRGGYKFTYRNIKLAAVERRASSLYIEKSLKA